MIDPLSPETLRSRYGADQFDFETTDDLDADTQIVGQNRAVEALEFGIEMDAPGYNVFAMGPPGTGRRDLVRHLLREQAAEEATPPDWCYVNNFDEEREPRAIQLEAGRGVALKEDVDQLVGDINGDCEVDTADLGILIGVGVVMLMQPFFMWVYSYSFIVLLTGTVMFLIVSHFPEGGQ